MEFHKWPKIPRYANETITITEKIDGTNAQLVLLDDGTILTGARNGWVTTDNDNYDFAKFIQANKEEILDLHLLIPNKRYYGEYWGYRINRGYGCEEGERYLSLFNAHEEFKDTQTIRRVPLIESSIAESQSPWVGLDILERYGSIAKPGYMNPEGIIVQYNLTGQRYKFFCKGNTDK